MSVPLEIDRRRFLGAALGAGAALAIAGLRPWRVLIESASPSLGERLTGLLEHRHSAGFVGREYLRHPAGEGDERALVEALARRFPGGPGAARDASGSELGELVAAAVDRDFAEEETIVLEGWVVARTEARLCALAALKPESARRA